MTAFLDLYVEEPVLGSDSRFLREAGVSFGRPTVGPVADDELPALARRRPDLGRLRFTALVLPFDLEDLPGGRRYVETTVRMTFDNPDVRSLLLSPPSRGTAEDSDIDTWGVGRRELTWKLTARSEQVGIRPSGRRVFAVLESPLACDQLTGTLDANVRFTRRLLGLASQSVAEPKRPLRFTLNVADGTFEVAPDQ
jgi:hypothetical protein